MQCYIPNGCGNEIITQPEERYTNCCYLSLFMRAMCHNGWDFIAVTAQRGPYFNLLDKHSVEYKIGPLKCANKSLDSTQKRRLASCNRNLLIKGRYYAHWIARVINTEVAGATQQNRMSLLRHLIYDPDSRDAFISMLHMAKGSSEKQRLIAHELGL